MGRARPRRTGSSRTLTGQLEDGTRYAGRLGVLAYDPASDRVQCHLCGRWFRALPAHLVLIHKWYPDAYREAFGLLRGQPLQAAGVSERQRRRAQQRYQRDPQVRAVLQQADALRAQGVLQAAVRSTAGRSQPLAKRRIHAEASRRAARRRLQRRDARLQQRARQLGFASLQAYLQARGGDQWLPAGMIATELQIGIDTARELLRVHVPARAARANPASGAAVRHVAAARFWQGYRDQVTAQATARALELGYPDLATCLHDHYLAGAGSYSQLQRLLGVSRRAVGRLLREHDITPARQRGNQPVADPPQPPPA